MGLKSALAPLFGWLVRGAVVKASTFTAVLAVLGFFVPMAVGFITPFLGVGNLSAVFGAVSPGIWFFLDFFRIDIGVPLLLSALVTRFLIRRLPFIG